MTVFSRQDLLQMVDETAHLPDAVRAAFGYELLMRVESPDEFMSLAVAARRIEARSQELARRAIIAGEEEAIEAPFIAIDMEHLSATATTHVKPGGRKGRPRATSSLRAGWHRFRAAEARLADSWAGDVLATICFVSACIGLLLILGTIGDVAEVAR